MTEKHTVLRRYIPDPEVSILEGFPGGRPFTLQTEIHGYPPYQRELQERSIVQRGVGDPSTPFPSQVRSYEWSSGQILPRLLAQKPGTKQEALDLVLHYLEEQTDGKEHPWAAMESYMRYQHYAAMVGYDYIGCEIGASVAGYHISFAFARGAAKQFNKRLGTGHVAGWFIDYSLWGNGCGMVNYSSNPMMYRHNDGYHNHMLSAPDAGQSPNATRRAYYMAYMSGAGWLINEAGGQAAFYSDTEEDGCYRLSPHGQVFREVYDFIRRHPDRGIPYIPFGILLNTDHGLPYGHWRTAEPFDTFPLEGGDWMTVALFRRLFPCSWPSRAENTLGQQVATPYGDTVDVLLQTASQRVLNSYPVLILSGPLCFTEEQRQRILTYVKQGGTLLLNTAYQKQFPELPDGQWGKGEVLIYGPDYQMFELPDLMGRLASRLLPFTVDGHVQYMINVRENSLVLTLINNDGVCKPYPDRPAWVAENARQQITVTYTGEGEVKAVHSWLDDRAPLTDRTQTVTLGPGEVEVLEFSIE